MIDWWRSWHGAPTDPKWLSIAKRAHVAPGVVSAVVWALLDHASQSSDRGSIRGYDAETMANFFGWEVSQIEAIVSALREKRVVVDDRFVSWEKRQPKREREDDSSERVQRFREKQKQSRLAMANVTPIRNADVTPRNAS